MKFLALGLGTLTVRVGLLAVDGYQFDPASLLAQIGLGAIIAAPWFYLWRDERKQRQAAELRERELMARFGPLLSSAADTLREVQQGMAATVERGAPDSRELDITVRRLELAIDEVRSQRGHGREQ